MKVNSLNPRKALNKAYLKVKPNRNEIEGFKANLIRLLDRINDTESEEFHKNLVSDFLKDTYYKQNHFINTKGRNDLVIHNGDKANSSVGVIIEAKKPTNKSEMVTTEKLNTKAFQELVLYYLRERITHKNLEVKHLVITNINEWYIFDVIVFDRLFAQNKSLVKQFNDFEDGRLADTKTDFFYKQIAEPFIAGITAEIEFAHFNLQDYQKPLRNNDKADDNKLIALFKLLSPEHLLKLPFANDNNSLNKRFYSELLHIIGLTETKEGSKKLIGRKKEGERNTGSILEDAIIQLDSLDKISRLDRPAQFGNTHQERLFNVALELSITWINRILFLKLLEAQLITYHKGDKSYSFLNLDKIKNYDDLNSLFFQVLARKYDERNPDVKEIFEKVPYLNSSLFEPTEIEQLTLFISNLKDDKTIPVFSSTVTKDQHGRNIKGSLSTLEYLFEFLNAFDFSSEGSEEIQEDNKTLINASVLGLIFEKINGYKDGSFFTPSFITMYMCRETIRKAVVQKFNESKNWACQDLNELYDKIEDRKEANKIVNSIKICDPAVGSGHFLVSALNEMIAVKNDLKILQDHNGKRLKEYHVEVANDELIVTDEEGELFEYNPNNKESQRIQETLFHEKQTIIENCLFGVDINPNSVKICRLRLWIELLKNAYYKNATELETLPNIDINIKIGNSLVSRFPIDADLKQALRQSKWNIDSYRIAVSTYRNAENKEQKREMKKLILQIKQGFSSEIRMNDPLKKRLDKLVNELYHRFTGSFLFEPDSSYSENEKKLEKKRKAEQEKLEKEINQITAKLDEIKANKIYENAFEWRFEFPEVLNDEGDFVGFDVVIGNPPYIRQEELREWKAYFESRYETYAGTADLLVYFFELSAQIMKNNASFCMITSNKFVKANYGKRLRAFLLKQQLEEIIDFGELPVFDEAATFPAIFFFQKKPKEKTVRFTQVETLDFPSLEKVVAENSIVLTDDAFGEDYWSFGNPNINAILTKMKAKGVPLGDYVNNEIFYGIKTGYNKAFVIDKAKKEELIAQDPQSAEIIFPFVIGDDVRFYHIRDKMRFIILLKIGVDINRYPAVFNHLKQYQSELEKRWDKGNFWWELRACAYYETFTKPKIMYPVIAKEPRFAFSENTIYSNDKTFFIPAEDKSLLGILNSKLIWNYLKNVCSVLGNANKGGRLELRSVHVTTLPIAVPSKVEKEEIESIVSQILTIKQADPLANTTVLEAQINQLVYKLYDLSEEDIQIIENDKH